MKISIWRQFSSNHSANFTIVGTFDSASAAQRTADSLRDDLRRIIAWYSQNEPYRQQVLDMATIEPTPIEKDMATQYGIHHEQVIDFLANSRYHDDMVQVFENHVFVSNGNVETFIGPNMFDQLMMKLGAKIALEVEGGEAVLVDIACEVPSKQIGDEIIQEADLSDETNVIKAWPWVVNHPKSRELDDILSGIKTFVENYHTQSDHKSSSVEAINNDYRISQIILCVSARLQQSRTAAEVTLDDRQLAFRGLNFSKIAVGLPAFLTWLESKGCKNIHHSIYQAAWNLPPGMSEDDL
ncbi:hypothetical protein G4Y79_04730 [Phototrophicus methaneseepsis]|uniref:Uncharacterized protein n=1 Tax=Phototrophicus methaneseepsis TaxID=2710758 RepID=A0A7S8EB34_9CHLR|nr:hypothetical protein [Phototrophicus methaneseepsis]QPC83691.1 hypothetical protein G4Y79_04730 [Phototrophicus methaneseepsis]